METTILISKIFGVIYLAFGIGMLVNPKFYKKEIPKLLENSAYLILGGLLAIVFGFLIIESQKALTHDWQMVLTVIGWIAIIKGVVLLAYPSSMKLYKPLFETEKFLNLVTYLVILVGALFIVFGFFMF
jgi:MFS family permease